MGDNLPAEVFKVIMKYLFYLQNYQLLGCFSPGYHDASSILQQNLGQKPIIIPDFYEKEQNFTLGIYSLYGRLCYCLFDIFGLGQLQKGDERGT
jgi:hypothetical protein